MNPFILTTYHSPKYFCDRETEAERLISAIENNRNTTLISYRRMGKTGLLKHLNYKLKNESNLRFIYFDIMTTSSIAEFVNLFANSIFNIKNSKFDTIYRNFSKLFSAFKPSFSINSITGETKFNLELSNISESENSLYTIFNYLANSKKKWVIAIDEFQQITNYPEKNFETILRSHIQHLNNAVFIFSGSSKEILTNIFTGKNSPFYMSSEIIYLNNIEKSKYKKFIYNHFAANGMVINYDCIEYLLDLVNTHTYYVQLLCNRLFSERMSKIVISDVNLIFYKILEENKFYFENYKNILTDYQWKLLTAIAKEKVVTEIMSKDFIARYKLGSPSSVQTAAKSLLQKEIVIKEDKKYMLSDLLLSAWLEL